MGAVFNAVAMDAQGTVIGVGVVVVSLLSVLLVVLLFLFFAIVLPKRVFHSIQVRERELAFLLLSGSRTTAARA